MLKKLFPPMLTGRKAAGLLVFRSCLGIVFLCHGVPKIKNPAHWMEEEGIDAKSVPLEVFVDFAEVASGLGFLLGLFTPLAALSTLSTMVGAMVQVHIPKRHPLVAPPGKPSAETSVSYAAASLALLMLGPGEYSLDSKLLRRFR